MAVRTARGGPELRAQEYAALRSEILKHIEFRYQITSLAVTLAGAILTLGTQSKNAFVLLMAPTPALFLALKWYEHGMQTIKLAAYIRTHHEPAGEGMWESSRYKPGKRIYGPFGILSALGLFLVPQIIACWLALVPPWPQEPSARPEPMLLVWDAVAIVLSGIFIIWLGLQRYPDWPGAQAPAPGRSP